MKIQKSTDGTVVTPVKTKSNNPILDLLFAGQSVRMIPREPEPWFVAADVCDVLGIKNSRDAIKSIPEKWVFNVGIADTKCAENSPRKRGELITRRMTAISSSAVTFLAFRSRKPEAQSFVDWLLEEVLPQIAKYGVYVAGTDPAERCTLLWHRWKLERAKELARADGELAANGLLTIALFAQLNQIELRDVLSFARLATQESLTAGEARKRVYTRGGMRRAYSETVLRTALARLQPRLPLPESVAEHGCSAPRQNPRRSDKENTSTVRCPSHGTTHGRLLAVEAALWPTPLAADDGGKVTLASHQGGLMQAAFHFSPHPQTAPLGVAFSGRTGAARRRLNPAFVCWLMGWPWFWTHPDATSFGRRETAWWRCKLRWLAGFYLSNCLGRTHENGV